MNSLHARRALAALLTATAGLVLRPIAAEAQAARTPQEQAVLALEHQLLQARVTGDLSAIRSGFADDAVYVQDSGDEWTKGDYLDAAAREPHWLGADETQQVVHVYGDAAVTHAVAIIRNGAGVTQTERTTGLYVQKAGRWQLESWQTTPIPPAK